MAEVAPGTPTAAQEMANWGRLLLDGIPFADMVAAGRRPEAQDWIDYWLGRADHYEVLAKQAVVSGHRLSAGEWFWIASLMAQYAQFLWFDDRRPPVQQRKVDLYLRAAPLFAPQAERFDLPFDGVSIPGYLRVPLDRTGPAPCAVLLGGLESTKEESYLFENLLLARGVATATFDGPGQGELLAARRLAPDFHRYTSRVVDWLETRADVDRTRLGVLGRSLGGFYALQSASYDQRFRACVSWGGFLDMDSWELETPLTKESWRYVSKVATIEEAREHVQACLDVRSVIHQLSCPTYFLHGALDEIPLYTNDRLRELATNATLEIVVEPEGDHCCHNLGPVPRVRMADWLADHLR